jgi:hypothetical protein
MNKKDFIKITNPNQFEIRAGYLANTEKKKIDYNINIYLFLPTNLSINKTTYSNDDFYNDHISYIRLITPKHGLGVLKNKLKGLVMALKNSTNDDAEKSVLKHEVKLVVCSYISYLRNFTQSLKDRGVKEKRVKVFLNKIKEFDNIRKDLLSLHVEQNDEKLLHLVESTVEYLSLTTQHYLFKINIHLKSFGDEHNELVNSIVKLINEEIRFCKKNNYPIISGDEYENEKVIFRYSVFKKYFYGVLYLYQKRKEDGVGVKEFYYALAAGISMIFTTVVVFATQQEYGNFTTSFFAALVISYMFKDRLKEAYRHYFDKKIALKTYDYKEKIYDADKRTLFAFIKERMRFVSKDSLDERVVQTRLKGVPNRLSTWYLGENIIKYEKNISLFNTNIQQYYNNRVNGIHNIMRFDVSKFLRKMDDPKVPLYRINENSLYGSKVYHVNIVVEYKSQEETSYHKARLILDKKGIKRVELPEFNLKIFPQNSSKREKNWFTLKKSGLLRKIIKEKNA